VKYIYTAAIFIFLFGCNSTPTPEDTTAQTVSQQIATNTQEAKEAQLEYLKLQEQRKAQGLQYAP